MVVLTGTHTHTPTPTGGGGVCVPVNTMSTFFISFIFDFVPMFLNLRSILDYLRTLLSIGSFSEIMNTLWYRFTGFFFKDTTYLERVKASLRKDNLRGNLPRPVSQEILYDENELIRQSSFSYKSKLILTFLCFLSSFLFSIFVLNSYYFFKAGEEDQHLDYEESNLKGLFFLLFPNLRTLPLVCAWAAPNYVFWFMNYSYIFSFYCLFGYSLAFNCIIFLNLLFLAFVVVVGSSKAVRELKDGRDLIAFIRYYQDNRPSTLFNIACLRGWSLNIWEMVDVLRILIYFIVFLLLIFDQIGWGLLVSLLALLARLVVEIYLSIKEFCRETSKWIIIYRVVYILISLLLIYLIVIFLVLVLSYGPLSGTDIDSAFFLGWALIILMEVFIVASFRLLLKILPFLYQNL